MRDIVLALVLAGVIPMCVLRPWFGALAWVWVSLMSPHRLAYGFMYDAPVALAVGGATLVGLVLARQPRRLPLAGSVVLLILFSLWMCVTFQFAMDPGPHNAAQLDKVLKINLMTLVVITLIHTRQQIDWLIAVVALSVAFYGVKGGLFGLATGGGQRVFGPTGFIAGNNEIGLALVMTIPLLFYLQTLCAQRWRRAAAWVSIFLCAVAAVSTQSRGALLAIVAMTVVFVLRSPSPRQLILPVLAVLTFIVAFMPDHWWQRMETIGAYQQDDSAMGRINAWVLAWNVARDNFFGGGFWLERPDIFDRYAPNPEFIAVAHSIYFQTLGQHGFVGLGLFLLFWMLVLRSAWWVNRNSQDPNDKMLARMIESSLVGYFVGGAFLNLAYYDAPYYLMAALVVLKHKVLRGDKGGAGPAEDVSQLRIGENGRMPPGLSGVKR